jgi:hypothetical protein
MNSHGRRIIAFVIVVSWLLACQALAGPPTATPEPSFTPSPTATPIPTITPTPWPSGSIDTGMGGTLTIQGVVTDSSGNAVPHVFAKLWVYGAKAGFDIGVLARDALYTDKSGSYAFNNVLRLQSGHYEIWFNGDQEYGRAYENSGYYVPAGAVRHNAYAVDVTVHAVTGSALQATVHYVDIEGSIRRFYSVPILKPEPGHIMELWRGTPDKREYAIGSEYGRVAGEHVTWEGLAGGRYFLAFTYRMLDGVIAQCNSSTFEVLPGETKILEYTIKQCGASQQPILP